MHFVALIPIFSFVPHARSIILNVQRPSFRVRCYDSGATRWPYTARLDALRDGALTDAFIMPDDTIRALQKMACTFGKFKSWSRPNPNAARRLFRQNGLAHDCQSLDHRLYSLQTSRRMSRVDDFVKVARIVRPD